MEAANHGIKSFKATLFLQGDGVSQTIEFTGGRCDQHADLTGYIAGIMRPRLENMSPGELISLRERNAKLQGENVKLNAELEDLRSQMAAAKEKAALKAKAKASDE